MRISDVVIDSKRFGDRFAYWMHFIAVVESTLDKDGNIIMENDHDGAGLTFCGLTQRDDRLPSNPAASWITSTYYRSYWAISRAANLPIGVGEEVANIAVNEGFSTSVKVLQQSVSALGRPVAIDGKIGPATMTEAQQEDAQELCVTLGQYNDIHYKEIAARNPNDLRFLRGWLNRDKSMIEAFAGEALKMAINPTPAPNTQVIDGITLTSPIIIT